MSETVVIALAAVGGLYWYLTRQQPAQVEHHDAVVAPVPEANKVAASIPVVNTILAPILKQQAKDNNTALSIKQKAEVQQAAASVLAAQKGLQPPLINPLDYATARAPIVPSVSTNNLSAPSVIAKAQAAIAHNGIGVYGATPQATVLQATKTPAAPTTVAVPTPTPLTAHLTPAQQATYLNALAARNSVNKLIFGISGVPTTAAK
jgi:hypothetical protein